MDTSKASLPDQTTTTEVEDPLIAALPPNTDYITYLTILEYQLTPRNLSTLNRLLLEDDGTLAAEIGWDLLKLIMPMVRVEPAKARECLDVIARRGNPREVIVRVAEELESLGQANSADEIDLEDGEDGLPTFAGEAPRVHLGDMKLAGMPETANLPDETGHEEPEEDEADAAVEELKLQTLLSMLGLLHPRIKTQYPSRFLATSLPAALSAHRRLGMRHESTVAFLSTLTQLAAKKRPALPPRVSTSNVLSVSAPLPDPESKTDRGVVPHNAEPNEAAINQRLVQAVLLEIIDEYTAASAEAQPPLTARLRARFEPHSITSTRRAQLKSLGTHVDAERADTLKAMFVSCAQDLKMDIQAQIENLDATTPQSAEVDEAKSYPTSPSQIPFSATGILLLYSAQQYVEAISRPLTLASAQIPNISIGHVFQTIDRQYENDTRFHHSTPAVDSLLSLLYIIFCTIRVNTATSTPDSETLLLATYNILQDIFTSCPDADLRDNAYHIASHLLHGHCQRETRLKIIKGLLETTGSASTSPIHEAQTGNLKSIAVDWLKDELYPTQTIQIIMERFVERKDRGLGLEILEDLVDLLFPAERLVEAPTTAVGHDKAIEDFAVELPFYISSLNLLSLILKTREQPTSVTGSAGETSDNISTPAASDLSIIVVKGGAMLGNLAKWKEVLIKPLSKAANSEGDLEVEGIGLSDIFALEDAIHRAREALSMEL